MLADRLLADSLIRGSTAALRGRVLPEADFEFRGGTGRRGQREGVRSHGFSQATGVGPKAKYPQLFLPSAVVLANPAAR